MGMFQHHRFWLIKISHYYTTKLFKLKTPLKNLLKPVLKTKFYIIRMFYFEIPAIKPIQITLSTELGWIFVTDSFMNRLGQGTTSKGWKIKKALDRCLSVSQDRARSITLLPPRSVEMFPLHTFSSPIYISKRLRNNRQRSFILLWCSFITDVNMMERKSG